MKLELTETEKAYLVYAIGQAYGNTDETEHGLNERKIYADLITKITKAEERNEI